MMKLMSLIETMPTSREYTIQEFKNKLSPGRIVVKELTSGSQADELYMYLDNDIKNNTDDYSNMVDSQITIRAMKIGEIAHDHHLGMMIDFALDIHTLFPAVITLDSMWRFLKKSERDTLRKFLKRKISDPNQQNNTNEKDENQTCQQVIEKYSKHRIII